MKLIWSNRYSDTDENDKHGRWARVGYLEHISKDPFKSIEVAWIVKDGKYYKLKMDNPLFSYENSFYNEDAAKEYCENIINDFKNNYMQ